MSEHWILKGEGEKGYLGRETRRPLMNNATRAHHALSIVLDTKRRSRK